MPHREQATLSLALFTQNDIPALRSALQKGANPNLLWIMGQPSPERPIHAAIREDCLEGLRLLLDYKADPNLRTGGNHIASSQMTPLLEALFHSIPARRVPMMSLLLQSGADPNQMSKEGWPPLFYAAILADPEALRVLLAAGADPHVLASDDGRSLDDVLHLRDYVSSDKEAVARALVCADILATHLARATLTSCLEDGHVHEPH